MWPRCSQFLHFILGQSALRWSPWPHSRHVRCFSPAELEQSRAICPTLWHLWHSTDLGCDSSLRNDSAMVKARIGDAGSCSGSVMRIVFLDWWYSKTFRKCLVGSLLIRRILRRSAPRSFESRCFPLCCCSSVPQDPRIMQWFLARVSPTFIRRKSERSPKPRSQTVETVKSTRLHPLS